MAGGKDALSLELRKQALILESQLNRLVLQAEWDKMRAATAWVGDAAGTVRRVRPWLAMLAPVAGFLAARQARQRRGIIHTIISAIKWARAAQTIWKSVAGRVGARESGSRVEG